MKYLCCFSIIFAQKKSKPSQTESSVSLTLRLQAFRSKVVRWHMETTQEHVNVSLPFFFGLQRAKNLQSHLLNIIFRTWILVSLWLCHRLFLYSFFLALQTRFVSFNYFEVKHFCFCPIANDPQIYELFLSLPKLKRKHDDCKRHTEERRLNLMFTKFIMRVSFQQVTLIVKYFNV